MRLLTSPRLGRQLRGQWTMPCGADVPGVLRARCRTRLDAWGVPSAAIEEAVMVLNELASNAVQHAGTGMQVRLNYNGSRIRIRVRDGSPRPPRLCPRSTTRIGGRGLQLVDAIADRWGWRPHAIGKT